MEQNSNKENMCSQNDGQDCREDLYGNCYYCGKNMLSPKQTEETFDVPSENETTIRIGGTSIQNTEEKEILSETELDPETKEEGEEIRKELEKEIPELEKELFKKLSWSNVEGINFEYEWGTFRNPLEALKSSISSLISQSKKEERERIEKMCPVIEEMRVEGEHLWVKIPNNDYKSFRLLPDFLTTQNE